MWKEFFKKLAEDTEKQKKIQNYNKQQKIEDNAVKCPVCRSKKIEFMGNDRKSFSVGKAVAGGVLTGGVGTLAGFAGKKGKENMWHCQECGAEFKK